MDVSNRRHIFQLDQSALTYTQSHVRHICRCLLAKVSTDATILAMASDSTTGYVGTYLCIGLRDTSSYQNTTWNNVAGYPIHTIITGDVSCN